MSGTQLAVLVGWTVCIAILTRLATLWSIAARLAAEEAKLARSDAHTEAERAKRLARYVRAVARKMDVKIDDLQFPLPNDHPIPSDPLPTDQEDDDAR